MDDQDHKQTTSNHEHEGDPDRKLLSWKAYEHEHKEKFPDWFWILGILTIALAIASIAFGNFLFALLIIITSVTLALLAVKKPDLISFEITTSGIRVDKQLHTYHSLESFWFLKEEGPKRLLVKSKKLFMPYIMIPVGGESIGEMRQILLKYLKEEEHEEPTAYKVLELLGF